MFDILDVHPIQIHNRFEQLPDHSFVYLNSTSRLGFLKSNLYFTTHYCVKKYESVFLSPTQKKDFKKIIFLYILLLVVTTFGSEVYKTGSSILSNEQKLQFFKGFFYY